MEERYDSRLRGIPPSAWPGLLARVSEVDELKGWWRGRFQAVPPWLGGLRKKTVAASANASARIDWIGIPRQAKAYPAAGPPAPIATPRGPRNSPAACYARVLSTVFEEHGRLPLGPDLVLRMHADLFERCPGDLAHPGRFRVSPDRAAMFSRHTVEAIALRPADPEQIPGEVDALFAWVNRRLPSPAFHPLLVVAGFVLEFLAIRPFTEGNGRTSRLLTNLLLLRCGYAYVPYSSLEKAIEDRKAEYYLALRRSQASRHLPRPDMAPWLTAFLDAMGAQARELKRLVEGRPRESLLSTNQARVLGLFDRHREVTNRLAMAELGLPRETAKQVLNRLLALNAIERIGAGRAVRYRRSGIV